MNTLPSCSAVINKWQGDTCLFVYQWEELVLLSQTWNTSASCFCGRKSLLCLQDHNPAAELQIIHQPGSRLPSHRLPVDLSDVFSSCWNTPEPFWPRFQGNQNQVTLGCQLADGFPSRSRRRPSSSSAPALVLLPPLVCAWSGWTSLKCSSWCVTPGCSVPGTPRPRRKVKSRTLCNWRA